jgi:hypothetical protein
MEGFIVDGEEHERKLTGRTHLQSPVCFNLLHDSSQQKMKVTDILLLTVSAAPAISTTNQV